MGIGNQRIRYPQSHSVQVTQHYFWDLASRDLNHQRELYCSVGKKVTVPVGKLICTDQRFYNFTTGKPNTWDPQIILNQISTPSNFSHLQEAGDNSDTAIKWQVPSGLCWTYETTAYPVLPQLVRVTCVRNKPSIFLSTPIHHRLPGTKVYGDRNTKKTMCSSNQKDGKQPLNHINQYYGRITWAEDRSWGYHTPIYILSCIIRLKQSQQL